MELIEKLGVLADSAKYDVSCSSSGSDRTSKTGIGNASISGICHSFSNDGRCISLLKILMTNSCIYDCKYCINRKSNNVKRAIMSPVEIANLTINFYKRNYIEGLFLSSGIIKNADYTMEKIYDTVKLLREEHQFYGYIHVKTIPGCSKHLINKLGQLVDRMSINLELPTNDSLKLLAPNKSKEDIATPMKYIASSIKENKKFVRAGQTTQMIVGATNDTDYKIMSLTEKMYQGLSLKRVYYSAYIPVNKDEVLPKIKEPSLIRENRLYQADWLLRFYNFKTNELLNENNPNFNYLLDPKANWAINNLNKFPIEINKVSFEDLIKVPGIGIISARKIIKSIKYDTLDFSDLKRMGVSLKRAKYFITCNGKYFDNRINFKSSEIKDYLIYQSNNNVQLSLSMGDING